MKIEEKILKGWFVFVVDPLNQDVRSSSINFGCVDPRINWGNDTCPLPGCCGLNLAVLLFYEYSDYLGPGFK